MTRSVVPAFFVIERHGADEAEEIASDAARAFNLNRMIGNGGDAKVFLCEASPTTELDDDDRNPRTLEGLTCDSGSDRSATGLITRIAEIGADSSKAIPTAFAEILQLAQGWLRQRMVLHPQASTAAAPGQERQSAAELLLHAFACAEANRSTVNPHTIKQALAQAQAEQPGTYAALLGMYLQQKDRTDA